MYSLLSRYLFYTSSLEFILILKLIFIMLKMLYSTSCLALPHRYRYIYEANVVIDHIRGNKIKSLKCYINYIYIFLFLDESKLVPY